MDHRDPANRLFIACPALLASSIFFWVFSRLLAPSAEQALVIEDPAAGNTDQFSKIAFSARIMPSQNSEDRSLLMVAENGNSEYEPYYAEGMADAVTQDFFTIDSTIGYFPTLRFTDLNVPAGSAKPYCLHLDWNRKEQRFQANKYHNVESQSRCAGAYNDKFRWQQGDPKDGADFLLWKQYSTKAPSADECEPNSIFAPPIYEGRMGTCFRYDVVDSVCVLVQFTQHEESASYVWEYKGGCYPGGKVEHYVPADPGVEYQFKTLAIEVREVLPGHKFGEDEDAGFSPSGSLSTLFWWLFLACFIGCLVVGFLIGKEQVEEKKR